MKNIEISITEAYELMAFLKRAINEYKYNELDESERMELKSIISEFIQMLESSYKLFALPYKLQLSSL